MYRLNVAANQIEECINKGMFALSSEPKIKAGEILLLQLKKSDWLSQGAKSGRIKHALVFQYCKNDPQGRISREHWPNAEKTWKWIVYASAVLDVTPFSLEDLPLTRESHYQAQANPVKIDPDDEKCIRSYINWPSAVPVNVLQPPLENINFLEHEEATKIEEYSIECARAEVEKFYPQAKVEVMNHNNPGFDMLVTEQNRVIRYIEVKGTQADKPIFHLTETERIFSTNNASLYSLLVVWMINLDNNTYKITKHDGEIPIGNVLKPYRYLGQLDS